MTHWHYDKDRAGVRFTSVSLVIRRDQFLLVMASTRWSRMTCGKSERHRPRPASRRC